MDVGSSLLTPCLAVGECRWATKPSVVLLEVAVFSAWREFVIGLRSTMNLQVFPRKSPC